MLGGSEPGLPKATQLFAVYILKVICDRLCDPVSTGPSRPQANRKENHDYFTLMGDGICKSEKNYATDDQISKHTEQLEEPPGKTDVNETVVTPLAPERDVQGK